MAFPGEPSISEIRASIDPLWSAWVQGYGHEARVMTALFPLAPVTSRRGRVIRFNRDSFRLSTTERAPGTQLRRRTFSFESDPYTLKDHGEQLVIPIENIEEAAAVPGLDLVRVNMSQFMETQTLRHEKDAAALALTAANYAAGHDILVASADQWDEALADPVAQMRTYKRLVQGKIGYVPNTLVLGTAAFDAALDNTRIRDQIKYTSRESITAEVLASLFDLEAVVVAESVYDDAVGTTTDIWTDDAGVLAYVDRGTPRTNAPADVGISGRGHGGGSITSPANAANAYDRRNPSYGYTYVVEGYPTIDGEFWDEDIRSWKYPFAWAYEIFNTFLDGSSKIVSGVLLRDIV